MIPSAPGRRGDLGMCDVFKKMPRWLVASAVALLMVFLLNWPAGSVEWAAWVQAFGSIGAIVAMGHIFYAQRKAEQVNAERVAQLERLRTAEQVQRVAYWSVEAIKGAMESRECGGAHQGLPFRSERLDQLRAMLERMAESSGGDVIALAALALGNNLNKTYLNYEHFDEQHRDAWLASMERCIQESETMYQNILAYEQQLSEACDKFKQHAS